MFTQSTHIQRCPPRRCRLASENWRHLLAMLGVLSLATMSGAEICLAQAAKTVVRERVRDVALVELEDTKTTPYLSVNVNAHTAPVKALAFSDDSSRLCSAGMDKVVHVWRMPGGGNAKAIVRESWRRENSIRWAVSRGQRGSIYAMSLGSNHEVAFAGYGAWDNASEIVWADLRDGSYMRTRYDARMNSIVALAHSPSGDWTAAADIFGRVMLWSAGEPKGLLIHDAQPIEVQRHLAFLGESLVVFPHYDGKDADGVPVWKLQYYDIRSRRLGEFKTPHYHKVTALAASGNGRHFASADATFWQRKWGAPPGEKTGRPSYGFHVNSFNGTWKRHDIVTSYPVRSISFSKDGQWMAVGTDFGRSREQPRMQLWKAGQDGDWKLIDEHRANRAVVTCAISPDGNWLAFVGGEDHDIFLHRVNRERPLSGPATGIIPGGSRLQSVALIDDAGSHNAVFRISDDDRPLRSFNPEKLTVAPNRDDVPRVLSDTATSGRWRAAIADRGQTLALSMAGSEQGRVTIDRNDWGSITCHAFLADDAGRPAAFAVGTNRQHAILVYALPQRGQCKLLRYFRGHHEQVTSLGTTKDRNYLVSSSDDGTIRYWKLAGYRDDAAVPVRWGTQIVLTADRKALQMKSIDDSSPLYRKGVRHGDVIRKIWWVNTDNRGESEAFSSTDPNEIYRKLARLPWNTQISFEILRDGKALPTLNAVSGWDHYLAVFVDKKDWIAWNPAGYYTSSAGGERLIGWQVNREMGLKPSFFEATEYAKSLHQPKLIQNLLKAGSLERAKTLAGLGQQAQSVTSPTDVQPPDVKIVFPEVPSGTRIKKVMDEKLSITAIARAQGKHPIMSMQLLLNGRPYQRQYSKGVERDRLTKTTTWEISPPPGDYEIHVLAETAVAEGKSDAITVQFVAEEPEPTLPTLHVLAIGISDYPEERLRLSYGRSDAESLVSTMRKGSSGIFENVAATILTDRQASRKRILAEMDALAKRVSERDTAVLFYSGHGFRDDQERFYLFNADGDRNNIPGSCVNEDEIKNFCIAVKCPLVLLVDACHSGAFRIDDLARTLARDRYGVVTLASSTGEEESFEDDKWGAGAFTKAITEALAGKADYNSDDHIWTLEAGTYVYDRVTKLTEFKQNPTYASPPIKPFHLSRILGAE